LIKALFLISGTGVKGVALKLAYLTRGREGEQFLDLAAVFKGVSMESRPGD
jgi:hypothetical protein